LDLESYIINKFGVEKDIFMETLELSPSSKGYILGAISELILKKYLNEKGFEIIRIKEKPSGGFNAKSVRGDFYIRRKDGNDKSWLLLESKGLKSNSEFRGSRFDNKQKLFNFLAPRVFRTENYKERIYNKGLGTYSAVKQEWEARNRGKIFPPFRWNIEYPGPESFNLNGLWQNVEELKKWIYSLPDEIFSEDAYRSLNGPISVLETHAPSTRIGTLTGIKQACPLVEEFDILAIDTFLRTKKHEFVFACAIDMSHSPTSPEHLYQNYIIDILVKDNKKEIIITPPWYKDIGDCIKNSADKLIFKEVDTSQLDNRETELI
jgi:hypothetical protein